MQAILDFLIAFGEILVSANEFFVGLIADIVEMTIVLVMAALQLPKIMAFLPSQIVALLAVFLTAAILYKVLGREG